MYGVKRHIPLVRAHDAPAPLGVSPFRNGSIRACSSSLVILYASDLADIQRRVEDAGATISRAADPGISSGKKRWR